MTATSIEELHDLITPNLKNLDEQFNEISPTQPLNLKSTSNISVPDLVRNSLISESSANTYRTAMDVEINHSRNNSQLSDINDNSKTKGEDETISGLGIDQIELNDNDNTEEEIMATSSIKTRSQTSLVYNDDSTPRVEDYSFVKPSMKSPLREDDIESDIIEEEEGEEIILEDETPVIKPSHQFNDITSNHGGSVLINDAKPVQLKRITQSPDLSISNNFTSPLTSIRSINKPAVTTTATTTKETADISIGSDNDNSNTTGYSQESNQLNKLDGYDKSFTKFDDEDEELTSLFLIALHAFDASTLELSQDSAICLSFDKNEVVYVHSVDSSGWGEVTLIKSLKRGWVPVNFFTELIKDFNPTDSYSVSKLPLKRLLISAAKFLNNPINKGQMFSIHHINDIRDGVKDLLEKTDCLSRSTEIVKRRPIIRRIRKSLLADWYSLMIKADSYKHSQTIVHLETLQLIVFQVLQKSITFLNIWLLESESLKKEINHEKLERLQRERANNYQNNGSVSGKSSSSSLPVLASPPFAKERLNEIHNILFNYIGLLLGRLDMVEHNPQGCQVLERITHQMILLLRELLFISKNCVLILSEKKARTDYKNDDNLDNLLSLVSELVSSVKNFVTKTIHEEYSLRKLTVKDGLYYYTPEGDDLIGIVSRMTRCITLTVDNCVRSLALTGDFKLSGDKQQYWDFSEAEITPAEFIRSCSLGLISTLPDSHLKQMKRTNIKRQSRFSTIRSGFANEASLTMAGSNLLQEFLPDSKPFIRDSVFEPYLNDSDDVTINRDIRDEIVYDSESNLIGASFKALVTILTDELKKPEPFFISTFFLTFKQYSTGDELIEELIERFNLTNKYNENDDYDEFGEFSSYESRLKNRRRLVVKMFQIWLESYWDYKNDYNLLPTLINFFNEGCSQYLPIESKKLIGLCSKLTVMTPTKIQHDKQSLQLIERFFGHAMKHSSSVYSITSLNNELDDDDYIFEEYELAKINSTTNNIRSSIYLPLPNFNSNNNNSLITKNQLAEIESMVLAYRRTLGATQWVHSDYTHYYPIEFSKMLNKWFEISQLTTSLKVNSNDLVLTLNLVDLNSFELAKQLTIIESKIFLSIKPNELIDDNFTKKKSINSPNVQNSLLFTNLLCEYIFDSILDLKINEKARILRLKNWLNVALSCYYLKNFNSLAAIIISLQNHILSRLTDLWDNLPSKYQNLFKDLKKIIHPTNNYKGYRYKLSKLLEVEGEKCQIPIVPYVNLFIQDLTFIQDGNKDFRNSNSFLRSKIINFDKFIKISKILSNLEFLQVSYDLKQKSNSKRNSIFTFNSSNSLNDEISPILSLQEFILLELWRVHQLNLEDNDRYWSLSKEIKQ